MNPSFIFNLGEGVYIVSFIILLFLLTSLTILFYVWMDNNWKGWFKHEEKTEGNKKP